MANRISKSGQTESSDGSPRKDHTPARIFPTELYEPPCLSIETCTLEGRDVTLLHPRCAVQQLRQLLLSLDGIELERHHP